MEKRALEIQSYAPPSWTTAQGVAKKLRLIKKKGLPSYMNAKRLTFTVDRNLFNDELAAMLFMDGQIRKFIENFRYAYRKCYSKNLPEFAYWFEFHADGWAHIHMDILIRHKLAVEWIGKGGILEHLWKIGNVHIKNISTHYSNYAFKYAFKPEGDLDNPENENTFPCWFMRASWVELVPVKDADGKNLLDADGNKIMTEKVKTFRRFRMWRVSSGFYTGEKVKSKPSKKQVSCEVPRTVAVDHKNNQRKIIAVARDHLGTYVKSSVLVVSLLAGEFLDNSFMQTLNGSACPTNYGVLVDDSILSAHVDSKNIENIIKLCQLKKQNQQTIQQVWGRQKFKPLLPNS